MIIRKGDPLEAVARKLASDAGFDPDERVGYPGKQNRTMPRWTLYREQARELRAQESLAFVKARGVASGQSPIYSGAPLTILGKHEATTIEQMKNCMRFGNVVRGVLCADGHLGYAQPVGGVIAYKDQISVSGVGFDIACGNMAVKLDRLVDAEFLANRAEIARKIRSVVSFGVGRTNPEPIEHELFEEKELWQKADMTDYLQKAKSQLGTVGSGNHYVDIFEDHEDRHMWIGVHFGSRGLGHTSATKYIKLAGGQDGIHVAPVVLDVASELGDRYHAAMTLAGRYAYAGREWVVEQVRKIVGGSIIDTIHNHHNYAWPEYHGTDLLWVVRKGATPAHASQRGFVGGSMGDISVILEGTKEDSELLNSTVHGAGRLLGRKEAKRTLLQSDMTTELNARDVYLSGGDLDEAPLAYRELFNVLIPHKRNIKIINILHPKLVLMAGSNDVDPWKD